jgi:hypothetical protein
MAKAQGPKGKVQAGVRHLPAMQEREVPQDGIRQEEV